jgi:mono/diheme cytochrome c family protein
MRRSLSRLLAAAAVLMGGSAAQAGQKLGDYLPQRAPEVVYAKVCGYCHGRNIGPILLGRKLPVDMITLVARQGRNGMPAFRPTEVTPAEMAALAKWISTAAPRAEEKGK